MSGELVILQREFEPRLPAFADVLAPYHIPAATFRSGVISLFEQNPYLLNCEMQSIMNACMSFAVQGLRLDASSQQACVVPFKKKAQPITMVKGYTVIAGRGGFVLQGRLVRQGDKIKEFGGADPRIEHEPILGNKGDIIGAYAVARAKAMPTLFTPFLTIDDLKATRDASKGYLSAKQQGNTHPWMTHFDQMCIKTPKRLLSKDIPNDMLQSAAWLDQQHDMGNVAYLRPDGHGVIDGQPEIIPETQPGPRQPPIEVTTPKRFLVKLPKGDLPSFTIEQWRATMLRIIKETKRQDLLAQGLELNTPILEDYRHEFPEHVAAVYDAFEKRRKEL